MIDRPSDGMGLDELREEFDWMFEFQSRMAERIRGDADVHSLVDYVGKLESDNAKLRELVRRLISHVEHPSCEGCGFEMNCDGEHVTQCDEWLFMVADARELGVEL